MKSVEKQLVAIKNYIVGTGKTFNRLPEGKKLEVICKTFAVAFSIGFFLE